MLFQRCEGWKRGAHVVSKPLRRVLIWQGRRGYIRRLCPYCLAALDAAGQAYDVLEDPPDA